MKIKRVMPKFIVKYFLLLLYEWRDTEIEGFLQLSPQTHTWTAQKIFMKLSAQGFEGDRLIQACFDYDGWLKIKLQHTLNCYNENEKYCTRANIAVESIRIGSPNIEQITFNKQHLKELQELADIDGFYSIKSVVTAADNNEMEFLSSVKARLFLQSGLNDIINIWMLPNGEVIAVNIQVANSTEPYTSKSITDGYINSNVYLHHIDQAPVPDTASYIQKLEREREAREKGDIKDNRSFLAKYWMYIVPVAIFVMLSGASAPEQPAQNTR